MWQHMWNGNGPGMWPWGFMMGFVWLVLFGLVIFFAVYAARQWSADRREAAGGPSGGPHREQPEESPREILDRRYAEGELSREEYERMKDDLAG